MIPKNRNFILPIVLLAAFLPAALHTLATLSSFVSQALWPDPASSITDMDFANYWIAGKLVLEGSVQDLFRQHEVYFAHMQKAFGADYPWHAWSYPPHYLLLVFWTGHFSYPWALVVFLLTSLAAMLFAMRPLLGRIDWPAIAVMMPVIAHNIWVGQNGFLTASLIIGGLALRDSRPILAGILIGLLTVKPHFGILIPFLLLAERRWLVFVSACVSATGFAALSILLFGIGTWTGYVANVIPYQTGVMTGFDGDFLLLMPTLYGTARSWGLDASPALILHMFLALPVLALALWFFVRSQEGEIQARTIVLLLATMLILPYSFTYDFALVSAALALIVSKHDLDVKALVLCVICACLPMMLLPLAVQGLTIAPFVLLTVYVWFMRRQANPATSGSIGSPVPINDPDHEHR